MSEEAFIQRTTGNIPPTPPNHLNIIEYNEHGLFPQGDVTVLEAGANHCAI
jgi:hypothetical protein